ncbi:MAG: cupin domain-containing protein [Pseudomonadota bacterium]
MEIIKAGARPAAVAPAARFTGHVVMTDIVATPAPARLHAVLVRFAPGARTFWHTHPLGQTLHVTEGVGRIGFRDAPPREIRAGDSVWIPPGLEHWHGAAPDQPMTHVAMQERLEGQQSAWLDEAVAETAYTASPVEP